MKSFTRQLSISLTGLTVVLPLCLNALPIYMDTKIINTPSEPTTVLINNNSHIQFYNARIKLKAGNTWTDLGNVAPGQNTFKVYAAVDNTPEVFEVQLENGQWLFSAYDKDNSNTIAFNIEASQDSKFKAALFKKYHKDIPALNLFSSDTHHVAFTPISTKLALNLWAIVCADGGEGYDGIYCAFGTTPLMFYYGFGGGIGAGIAGGGFASSGFTPQQLLSEFNYLGSTQYVLESELFLQEIEIIPIGAAVLGGLDETEGGGEGMFSPVPYAAKP